MEEEANEVKSHAKLSSTSKNKEISFKASKSKQVQESSSSEDESSEDEAMAFFVKRFKKFMKKKQNARLKKMEKRQKAMYASMNLQPPCSPIASEEEESAQVEFENPWVLYDEAQAAAESSQAQHIVDSSDEEEVYGGSSSNDGDSDGSGDDDDGDEIYQAGNE
ncbi:uncharacterized protein LOC133930160 [Phragmites australis]|uniref:uncharacterized protein LOC133930160 n=1 Tax=Phragmites australis TaxID=29695 RepID=UPI002D77292B|nr:uncharacterized protein LOC133930160 [Phragmites australis]